MNKWTVSTTIDGVAINLSGDVLEAALIVANIVSNAVHVPVLVFQGAEVLATFGAVPFVPKPEVKGGIQRQ